MTNLHIFLISLIIPIAVNFAVPIAFAVLNRRSRKKENKMDKDDFIIYFISPKLVISLSIFMTLLCALLCVACYFAEVDDFPYWIFSAIVVVLVPVELLIMSRWKLAVKGEKIIFTFLFGKPTEYDIREITHLIAQKTFKNNIGYVAYCGTKKAFDFSSHQTGAILFIKKAEEYKIHIRELPEIPPTLF